MNVRSGKPEPDFDMQGRRNCDHAVVKASRDQRFKGIEARDIARPVEKPRIGDSNEVNTVNGTQEAKVMAAHHT
jgi:hypothetical protein